MFPIRDSAGRTVAFTGRALDKEEQAKYLNSPETELFKKSQVLFGMDRAKDAIRSRGFALLVEGQFDVILAHQAGFANTIALSGTALSHHTFSSLSDTQITSCSRLILIAQVLRRLHVPRRSLSHLA